MKATKTFLLHLPDSLLDEIDDIVVDLCCSKSQFVRQSILRNLDICRNVEIPLLRSHYRQSYEKLDHILSRPNH